LANIVDTAISAGSFKTLVAAVQAADLVDTLKSPGPFTVFAPNDEAFAALPKGALDDLLKDKAKLQAVLTYHVVSGNVTASDVIKLKTAKTVQGQELRIDASRWRLRNNVKVNDANVIKPDIMCDNGIIHVIDKVLMPSLVAEVSP
jgi:uncharacterized surface protein with fasciclin (FAS1) repeats